MRIPQARVLTLLSLDILHTITRYCNEFYTCGGKVEELPWKKVKVDKLHPFEGVADFRITCAGNKNHSLQMMAII